MIHYVGLDGAIYLSNTFDQLQEKLGPSYNIESTGSRWTWISSLYREAGENFEHNFERSGRLWALVIRQNARSLAFKNASDAIMFKLAWNPEDQ